VRYCLAGEATLSEGFPGRFHIVSNVFPDCAGPVTGAHFNPLITMGTFCARLTSLPRMILYIIGQSIGAILGAFMVRASLGVGKHGVRVVPGCFIDSSLVSPAEAWGKFFPLSFGMLTQVPLDAIDWTIMGGPCFVLGLGVIMWCQAVLI
jgi:hypothetical protein